MQLIKSLLCAKGYDNRQRYAIVMVSLYMVFALISAISMQYIVVGGIALVAITVLSAFTIIRRLNDARLKKNWIHLATALFVIAGIIILVSQSPAAYWLLLLPLGFSALLLTYPSHTKYPYIMGYYGPVDLSEYQARQAQQVSRIEPSFAQQVSIAETETVAQGVSGNSFEQPQWSNTENTSGIDIGEMIREKLLENKNSKWALGAVITIVATGIIWSTIVGYSSDSPEQLDTVEQEVIVEQPELERLYAIDFPDNFTLMLTEHSGLIVSWQADAMNTGKLWQQISAEGDQKCQALVFNNKKSIRTIEVLAESNGDNYAYFSPLDTQTLIQNIAFKSSFTLCGYDFSLKGTQAILGKNSPYSEYVSY